MFLPDHYRVDAVVATAGPASRRSPAIPRILACPSEARDSTRYFATLTRTIAVDSFPDASVHRIVTV
jgi:hypothetical protein